MKIRTRIRNSAPVAGFHFVLGAFLVSVIVAIFTIKTFPLPFFLISGVATVLFIVVAVDAVCGPLATLLTYSPFKSKLERSLDFSIIVLAQISFLAYGLYTVYSLKPLAFVFEVDRFRLLSFSNIPENQIKDIPLWAKIRVFEPPALVATKKSNSIDDQTADIDYAMQGVDIAQRPSRWLKIDEARALISEGVRPMAELDPKEEKYIIDYLRSLKKPAANVGWLYATSSRKDNWIVIINKDNGAPLLLGERGELRFSLYSLEDFDFLKSRH